MNFPFFIARRFFRHIGDSRGHASNPTITIATAGVAVGLAVMIVTVCVIMGFKREVMSKVRGFASDIEVLDIRSLASPEGYPVSVSPVYLEGLRSIDGVKRVDCIAQKIGLLKTDAEFQGVTLKGLPQGYDSTFIAASIVEGRMPQLCGKDGGGGQSNEILLSRMQADALGLKVGSRVFTYFFEENIRMRRFSVCGIYCTNMGIFDKNVAITDFATVAQLNGWQNDRCSSVEIRLEDFGKLPIVQAEMLRYHEKHPDPAANPRRPLSVTEHYQQVFSWLNLLDTNMLVIIVLMFAVAGFTMISGLLILIIERTGTIGILKALGATNTTIRRIFLTFAAFITIRGLLIGDVLALALLFAQKYWGFAHLDPASYYVDTIPVEMAWWPILLLNAGTLLVTVLTLVGPSFAISHIQPAKSIRYE